MWELIKVKNTFDARSQILSSLCVLITSNYGINGSIGSVQKCCKIHVFDLPKKIISIIIITINSTPDKFLSS